MSRYHISISAYNVSKNGWGDLQYVQSLAHYLKQLGHEVEFFFAGEEPRLCGKDDIVLRVVGPHLEEPVKGATNLVWVISPPNLAPLGKLARFDHVFLCSPFLADYYSQNQISASFLPQATDTTHFHPQKADQSKPAIPVCFVGNFAPRVKRDLVFKAYEADVGLQVWGGGWDKHLPSDVLMGKHLDYDELAEVYARSDIILNSQMDMMSTFGMMANRSFDALSSGALVLSDTVTRFDDQDLPGLVQIKDHAEVKTRLEGLLNDRSLFDLEARMQRHLSIENSHSFKSHAEQIDRIAQSKLTERQRTEPPRRARAPVGQQDDVHIEISDHRPNAFENSTDWSSDLDDLGGVTDAKNVAVTLTMTPPESSAEGMSPQQCILETAYAILRLSKVFDQKHKFTELKIKTCETGFEGEIHLLMADLRAMQALVAGEATEDAPKEQDQLVMRAQIVRDCLSDTASPFGFRIRPSEQLSMLQRAAQQMPLYPHSPAKFTRDRLKPHARLWPRRAPVKLDKPVGVFIHLYYDDLAEPMAHRCGFIDAPKRFYISTDSEEKIEKIARHFPEADIRVFPNFGRDIYPKYFGFSGVYKDHDVVLHLHGKKSLHANKLDNWLSHILDSLLPSPEEVNRLLSFFQTVPRLGLVTPLPFKDVLSASHWGSNFDLARELAARLDIQSALPLNDELVFPVGSMFWARSKIVERVASLNLGEAHFPKEMGQVDGTIAHAIERLIGVVCADEQCHQMAVARSDSTLFNGHARRFSQNRDLREALENSETGGFG